MPQPNIKLYLALSGVLAIILIVILVIPLGMRNRTNNANKNFPTPTTVQSAGSNAGQAEGPIPTKEFTGVEEEALPQEIVDQSTQKKELRYKTPLSFTTFSIDFDYAEDKFKVALLDPKDSALKEFEEWKKNSYPLIPMDQFIFN